LYPNRCAHIQAPPEQIWQAITQPEWARPDSADAETGLDNALALLAGVPERQRAALTLRYVFDLPDAAIAVALDCSESTVRSLLLRGRATLRSGWPHNPTVR
jgi:RNA polymerase sigma factor (sigma-70 family)